MKKLIFVTILLIAILPVVANLAFDEPVSLYDFENYELSPQSKICPNGNQVLLFLQSKQGIRNTYMQIYSPENQALWAEPVLIGHRWISDFCLVVNPDNSIAVSGSIPGGTYIDILNTYDQTGNLIPERSNITVYYSYNRPASSRSLISDGLGGLHFSAKGSSQGYFYQHIDALGNLAHPVQGLLIPGARDFSYQMIATEDHGALLSIPTIIDNRVNFKFVKISPDHQIDGEFVISNIEDFPRQITLISKDLNSFYIVWETNSYAILANKVNYSGECLWAQDWTPSSNLAKYSDTILVNSEGELIVYYYVVAGDHYPYSYISHFDVINSSGSMIHSQLTYPPQPYMDYSSYHLYPVADNAGGWFLACVSEDLTVSPQNYVQHFTHDYTSWPNVVLLADNAMYSGLNTLSAQLQGDDLQLLYQNNQDNQSSIYSQIIDSQANLSYPQPGFGLQMGAQDNAFGMKSIALQGGACLSLWRQGANQTNHVHKLMYNIISPRGNSLFPAAQCLLENAAHVSNYEAFPVGDSQMLIVWTTLYSASYTSRAQLLDLSGNPAWEPEGRLLYSGLGQPFFSTENEVLYMARSINTEVRLHRFVNGIASWQPEGILAAAQNPGYLGSSLRVEALAGNRLFWSQNAHEGFPEMSFMNIVDAAGNLQYPVEGLPLANLGSDYFGLRPSHYYWQGDTLVYVLAYYYRVWEYDGGHSSDMSWHYYPRYKLQTINPDGSLGPAPSAAQDIQGGANCLSDDAYYVAFISMIWKYDLSGNLLWHVPYSYDSSMKEMCPLPDGRVLLVTRKYDYPSNDYLCQYSLLDTDGNIETPADTFWGTGNISDLISTDYGVYLILTPYSESNKSQYSGVQYYAVNAWSNDDPHVSPPVQLLSQNFPNPFKEHTRICLKLDESAPATLKVYNIRGQHVKTLCDGDMPKGESYLDWDGKDDKGKPCASGVYIIRAKASKKSKTIKILKMQ